VSSEVLLVITRGGVFCLYWKEEVPPELVCSAVSNIDLTAVCSSLVQSCTCPKDRNCGGIGIDCSINKVVSVSVSTDGLVGVCGFARMFGFGFAGVLTKRPVLGSLLWPLMPGIDWAVKRRTGSRDLW
jgi:hypothetical protein